jgi:heat shock protein HtpX
MNTMKVFFLMATLTVLLVIVGNTLGGESGMIMAFLFAVVMNFGTYWFSDKIVLRMYRARELTPDDNPVLFQTTEQLVAGAGLPMPRLYLIKGDQPNAFATGRNPRHAAVAVTEGIARLLSREELRGVIAHELAHIKRRDTLIGALAATFAGAISMLANMGQWAMIFGGGRSSGDRGGGHPVAAIAMMIVAPIAAMMIQMAISRSRELLADQGGAQMAGNPLPLANALRKLHLKSEQIPMEASPVTAHLSIVNPLHGRRLDSSSGGVMKLFSTHPPIEERVARLEAMVYGENSRWVFHQQQHR